MMINVSSLAYAVYTSIASDAALVTSAYSRVEYGMPLNQDDSKTPWVGVWPGDMRLEAKMVGGKWWRGSVDVLVYHQVANRRASPLAELKQAQAMIITAVGSDIPMKAQALQLTGIEAVLDEFDPRTSEGYLQNLLRFTYLVEGQT